MNFKIKAIADLLINSTIAINITAIFAYLLMGNNLRDQYILIPIFSMVFLWLPSILIILFMGIKKLITKEGNERIKFTKSLFQILLSLLSFCAFLIYAYYFID